MIDNKLMRLSNIYMNIILESIENKVINKEDFLELFKNNLEEDYRHLVNTKNIRFKIILNENYSCYIKFFDNDTNKDILNLMYIDKNIFCKLIEKLNIEYILYNGELIRYDDLNYKEML